MVTSELLEKAKKAETSEELLTLAKENGVEMTAEEAKEYFDQLHKSGELSDEELDNVAGGGCHAKDGRLVVTAFYGCEHWACHLCGDTTKYNAFTGGAMSAKVLYRRRACANRANIWKGRARAGCAITAISRKECGSTVRKQG